METMQIFIIRQKVNLANDTEQWIDIATFNKEHNAWEAFDKAKIKNNDVVLVKLNETILS